MNKSETWADCSSVDDSKRESDQTRKTNVSDDHLCCNPVPTITTCTVTYLLGQQTSLQTGAADGTYEQPIAGSSITVDR